MTIHAASKNLNKLLLAIGLVATLASCGGGGGGAKKDSTPDSFTITPVSNAAVATEVTSAPVTVTGFNQSVPVSISGGTYSIGGGAYTSSAGIVTNGQVITVKVTASDKTNTPVTATLTVGGVSSQFTATTVPDVTPTAFSFTAAANVGAKSVNTSNEITVAGIDVAVPISITSGEYSINGAAYTSAAGTVSKDQKVIVRATASDKPATKVTAALTIGGITGNYEVTTYADSVAPTAQILFPPPVSMTEGNTILIRGSASDEFSAITSVKVNGVAVTPKATGDFSSWQVSVPLTATKDNNVVVTTEDSVGNKSTNAAKVVVRQGDHKNAYPNNNVPLAFPHSIAVDRLGGRNRVLVSDTSESRIVSIDLATGERSIFASGISSRGITIEPSTQRLYAVDLGIKSLVYFNLVDATKTIVASVELYERIFSLAVDDSGSTPKIIGLGNTNGEIISNEISSNKLSVLSDGKNGVPDTKNLFNLPSQIAVDKSRARYLVANGGQSPDINQHAVYTVDSKTGVRTILSNNITGIGDSFSGLLDDGDTNSLQSLLVDEASNQAIVGELLRGRFLKVDLTTGNRILFSDSSLAVPVNPIKQTNAMSLFETNQYLLVSEGYYNGIFVVDVITGERVIFSKAETDY